MTKTDIISLEDRKKIEKLLEKYGIRKNEVANESGMTYRSVARFFNGTQHNASIYRASKKLISQRISSLTRRSTEATNDLVSLVA